MNNEYCGRESPFIHYSILLIHFFNWGANVRKENGLEKQENHWEVVIVLTTLDVSLLCIRKYK